METLFLGFVSWIICIIVVEGRIFAGIRSWADELEWFQYQNNAGYLVRKRPRLSYFVTCYLCAGTWISLGIAALTSYRPVASSAPLVGWLLSGLLYQAIGHTILAVNNVLRKFGKET